MDVPSTVETALADRPVAGRTCLEAGAGTGNTTAGLVDAGARRVYAVTDDREHAHTVRERVGDDRTDVIEADLRLTPLPAEAVELITAHGLFNVVAPPDTASIVAELSRVAAPGAHLVVDDYAPLPDADIRDLFAIENAVSELARSRPAMTFYRAAHLRSLFESHGWSLDRRTTLLDPVPWTASHVRAHLDVVREYAAELDGGTADPLLESAERLADEIESTDHGEMYSLAFRR